MRSTKKAQPAPLLRRATASSASSGDVHGTKRRNVTESQATLVIDTVRELGADLVGTGRFADEYRSPVGLGYRFNDE